MLYYLLFIASICLVISTRINTDNTLKLIGIGFIAVGALVGIEKQDSVLIEIGVLFYFVSNLMSAYFGTRKRRYYDKEDVQARVIKSSRRA
jgi:hypothetical protein